MIPGSIERQELRSFHDMESKVFNELIVPENSLLETPSHCTGQRDNRKFYISFVHIRKWMWMRECESLVASSKRELGFFLRNKKQYVY